MKIKELIRRQLVAVAGTLLALALVIVVPAVRVRAQPKASPALVQFVVSGFQADSSSPFVLSGDQIGEGAVWQHLDGPFISNTLGLIPGAPETFGGVGCRAEYSQDQIVAKDGSTITVNVFGTRCQPYSSPGAHTTNGSYSLIGGTGRFKDVTHGTGTVTIDANADGSTSLAIEGFLIKPTCAGGSCGS